MKNSPQLRLAIGLVSLLFSVALIGETLGFVPRAEDGIRQSRKLLTESLAVQLSDAATAGKTDTIARTLSTLVKRNEALAYGELTLENGTVLAQHGIRQDTATKWYDFSSFDEFTVPIFKAQAPWGEVKLHFARPSDPGLRYLGIPSSSLVYIAFLCLGCLFTFFLFLRKALKELNPTKAVPERVHSAFEVLAEGVLILDEKQRIVLANKSFAQRVNEDPATLIGKCPNAYNWDLSGEGAETLPWQLAFENGERVMGMHLRLTTDEQQISFAVNAAPILDQAQRSRGVLITFDDVSHLEQKNTELATMLVELNETQKVIEIKNRELETLATRDGLTGFLNRRSFLEFYAEHFDAARKNDTPLSVLMVDIDHFKSVNDNFGHLVGDQAIVAVSGALGEFFRKNDYVGRYGGEEFVVSLPGSTTAEALKAADRVREHIGTLANSDELPMDTLTVSIGLASQTPETADMLELLDRADRGLYKAKETGRNQVCEFDPDYESDHEDVTPASDADANDDEDAKALRYHLEKMKHQVQAQAEEMTYRSLHDDVTQLPNRFLLCDRIGQAVKQARRTQKPGAVISISLSGYQRIFDIEGHGAAEQLMSQAAKMVQSILRDTDSVSTLDDEQSLTCSRIAHNELALLAIDLEEATSATRIVERVTAALEQAIVVGQHEVFSRVYCGIALFPVDSENPDALIRNATLARKFARGRSVHRSGNAYFSPEIDAQAVKNAHIAAELHKAISAGALSVAYQPKVDSTTRQIAGVEALARWVHPELGHISPADFISVAEHIGVIHILTNWVLGQVCRDLSAGLLGDVRVSVNISPHELSDPDTAQRLLDIMAQHEILPSQIEIEVTESSFLNNYELGRDLLLRFRKEGILISLDDFGTGYSSLNMLTQIPIDIIKIDRSFISDIHRTSENHAIVQAILQMSRSLGMRVVAEGVECDEEYACLKLLGCGEMQGYYFARPMSAHDLREYTGTVGIRPRLAGTSSGDAAKQPPASA